MQWHTETVWWKIIQEQEKYMNRCAKYSARHSPYRYNVDMKYTGKRKYLILLPISLLVNISARLYRITRFASCNPIVMSRTTIRPFRASYRILRPLLRVRQFFLILSRISISDLRLHSPFIVAQFFSAKAQPALQTVSHVLSSTLRADRDFKPQRDSTCISHALRRISSGRFRAWRKDESTRSVIRIEID